ncbi:hypothetical protein [Winogradskyella alexanderae]|uniref:DUF4377 domain-containing protein n=1 Tax=Winogradskyella alexanderae TaxID=2877123 RepID=A0ABS7XSY1_9FLAO|nr:hypothetical protein [Winogradskyella alexanderae]MCA0133123.1 hypothetical protein [Winogradskyella alexanderae]
MKNIKTLSIVLLSFLFLNCENFLECIIPREPELQNATFPIGNTESYYYTEVRAEINNEPRDQDYDYYFEVRGLPLGMDYFVNFRTISLEGRPQETGAFEVTIFVDVDGPFRADASEVLCDYSTSKTYTLIIEE